MSLEKLGFICAQGLDLFIDPVIEELSDNYFVRKFIVKTQQDIYDAIDWADIVWFEWANEVAIYGTIYERIRKKKVIVRLHSYEALSEFPKKVIWENVDRLIFVAPHIREILKESMPDIEKRVQTEIVYNGLDLNKIPFTERKTGFNIAWVGYINHKKNPQFALQIMQKLVSKDKQYKLHVAGSPQELRYKIYMEYMVKELSLVDNVIFYGWVDDMERFWMGKNYLLSTSIHEGHPYNIMEAMARGIKPVIHNFRGARELYSRDWLYNTIDEAVEKIFYGGKYYSKAYRQWIIEHGWTLENQLENIKKIIRGI